MKIDMGWPGPIGNDVEIGNGIVYLHGTNHWLEWVHHFIPWAGRREVRWARDLVHTLTFGGFEFHTLSGHSIGGTVATIAARLLAESGISVSLFTYGAKRPPRDYFATGKHYAIRHDIVPKLPPWRDEMPLIVLDYGNISMEEAHKPSTYREQMKLDGIR